MRLADISGKDELVIKVNTLVAIKGVHDVRVSVEVGRSTIPPELRISTPTGIETEFFNQNPLQETIEIKAKI